MKVAALALERGIRLGLDGHLAQWESLEPCLKHAMVSIPSIYPGLFLELCLVRC